MQELNCSNLKTNFQKLLTCLNSLFIRKIYPSLWDCNPSLSTQFFNGQDTAYLISKFFVIHYWFLQSSLLPLISWCPGKGTANKWTRWRDQLACTFSSTSLCLYSYATYKTNAVRVLYELPLRSMEYHQVTTRYAFMPIWSRYSKFGFRKLLNQSILFTEEDSLAKTISPTNEV